MSIKVDLEKKHNVKIKRVKRGGRFYYYAFDKRTGRILAYEKWSSKERRRKNALISIDEKLRKKRLIKHEIYAKIMEVGKMDTYKSITIRVLRDKILAEDRVKVESLSKLLSEWIYEAMDMIVISETITSDEVYLKQFKHVIEFDIFDFVHDKRQYWWVYDIIHKHIVDMRIPDDLVRKLSQWVHAQNWKWR